MENQIDEKNTKIFDLEYQIKKIKNDNISAELEKHPIDKMLSECISKNSSTAGMNKCTYDASDEWEKEMNKNLDLLKSVMTKEQYHFLQKSQENWEKYKMTQYNLIDEIILKKMGTMYSTIRLGYRLGIIKDRAQILHSLYDTFPLDYK